MNTPIYLYLQTQKWNPIDIGIRFVTRSSWSHAGIYHDEMFLSAQKDGVKWRGHDKNAKLLFLKIDKANDILAYMNSQLGVRYDFGAIFGILVDRNWRDESRWFCSELVAWACEKAGNPLLNVDFQLNRVFPDLVGASTKVTFLTEEERAELPEDIRVWVV
jgi:hypothetical protein